MTDTPAWALEKIQEAKKKQLKELDLSNDSWGTLADQKLTAIPSEIFELEELEALNLYNNLLTAIPDSIHQLRNLTSLNLGHNELNVVPEWIAKLRNLMSLNLRFNNLTTVPEWIAQLRNLTSLDLSLNNLTTAPEWIAQLRNLTSLDLSFNNLTAIPKWIIHLESLTSLDLNGNDLKTVPKWIAQLHNLTELMLYGDRLKVVPNEISQLHNLNYLCLGGDELKAVPEWIPQLRKLTKLHLYLSGDQPQAVPKWIAQLHNLIELVLSGFQLTAVPEWISELQNLELLRLSNNSLSSLPEGITRLQKLRFLDLHENLFIEMPDSIYELLALEQIMFSGYGDKNKNRIKEISPKILQLEHLKKLKLDGNFIETPPLEILNLKEDGYVDIENIKNYFRQLESEGKDYLYEAKLLIVGEGGAGKTTLAKKIETPDYQLREGEVSTEGIDVTQWHFPMENGKNFRVNIWDFGGQEIYHATHQFFLTKRSLYALVADTRKEDTDFYYWLNIVELLSDNSPLLIIKNEKQDRHREINERQLRGQFENLKETLATNLDTNRGLPEVLNQIKYYVRQLPHIGSPLPKTWVKVREALEKDSHNHISLDEYLNICQQNGFTELKDNLQLSGYLHDLGVCLHFQEDPLLKKIVILKPKWGTDAAYKVLDNKTIIRNLGRFTRADLVAIWNQPEYMNMQDELLQLMINFKLCYKIPASRDTYIAPQLLTENQPDYDWDEANNLVLRYTYEFMPKGILTQFIVAMHSLIADQNRVWKSGVVLEEDRTRVEVVEYYGKREIKIRIAGNYKKDGDDILDVPN